MATFTIKFEGLIMHYGSNAQTKTHAVVVDDDEHVPLITIPGKEVIPEQNNPLVVELFDGDTITFDPADLLPGTATGDSSFTTLVPQLKSLVRGSIRGTVASAMHAHGDGALTFLTFPKGSLSAPETLDHPLHFRFPSDDVFVIQHCVAAGVLFTATPRNTSVRMTIRHNSGSPRLIEMKDYATMEVTNVSAGGAHFPAYAKLMAPGAEIARATEVTSEMCNLSALESALFVRKIERMRAVQLEAAGLTNAADVVMTLAPNPECSNSAWP